jgi:hypothetical protein
MPPPSAPVELQAELNTQLASLQQWVRRAPDWPPARACQALVQRLAQRTDDLRVRLEAPLVVALLGGTGTGKSSLVNALAGEDVTTTGQQRPTTRQPVLVCRSDLSPLALGIDPAAVETVHRDTPLLRDLVLLDCPDPDTTEDSQQRDTNLARLRQLLPHCDVLLVTATQQKYRSAVVLEELLAAAPGARPVYVQTHADIDQDIRADWREHLPPELAGAPMFFVDSLSALADAKADLAPRGEFGRLVDYLERELSSAAACRIRRSNFLNLAQQTLAACLAKIEVELPKIDALDAAISEHRSRLSSRLADQMGRELLANRRHWENRLLGEAAARWGFSPFSLVLRAFHGLGGLLTSAALLRVRSPGQLAIWGTLAGGRWLREQQTRRQAMSSLRALGWNWDEAEVRTAAIIVDGYAAEAGLPRQPQRAEQVLAEAAEAGARFVDSAATQLQALIQRLADRHARWYTRWAYELAFLVMFGALLYRLGRNFFYDSWLAVELGHAATPAPVLGTDFFLQAAFWLLLWCVLLLWMLTSRLRRGLKGEIIALAQQWGRSALAGSLFASLEQQVRAVRLFRDDLQRLEAELAGLHSKLALSPGPIEAACEMRHSVRP